MKRFLLASAALFAYGGWAYIANMTHGVAAGVKAALVQGGYSFALTLVVTLVMEFIARAFDRPVLKFAITFISTCGLLFAIAYGINYAGGTPEIMLTIMPGFVLGCGFALVYSISLVKFPRSDKFQLFNKRRFLRRE